MTFQMEFGNKSGTFLMRRKMFKICQWRFPKDFLELLV